MLNKSPGNPMAPAHALAEHADARHIAEATVITWRAVDAALAPVIGHLGVAALHRRSLHLIRAEHPFLADLIAGALAPAADLPTDCSANDSANCSADSSADFSADFSALRDALSQQSAADAAAASSALQRTFHDLLSSLIGHSLTARLLSSVWQNPSSGPAAQDTSR